MGAHHGFAGNIRNVAFSSSPTVRSRSPRVRLQVVGDDPELLDVVPWSHGYAHSWVLSWLIGHEPSRTPILNLLAGIDGGPWALSPAGGPRVLGSSRPG